MYSEFYAQSGHELICQLGKRFAQYRKRMGYTQRQVAAQSGLSVFTISSFENGSSTGLTMASFIRLLRAIGFLEEISKLLPELPESPRLLYLQEQKRKGRGKRGGK